MRIRPSFAALAIAPLLLAFTPPMAMGAGRSPSPVVNTIRNGKGAPKSSLGIDGDFYIDTRSLVLYGPKKKGKWPAPRNLQGPAGATGSSGSDGKSGSDGRTITTASTTAGPQGVAGAQGPQGLPGVKGEAGANGAPGATGAQGPQGTQGQQGIPGVQGAAGVAEVTVVNIPQWVLSSATPFSVSNSQSFGTFEAGKSYLLQIFISGRSINSNLSLGIDLISAGASINFSYSRGYSLYANYSTNQWIYTFEITAVLVVGATNTSMSLRVIDGLGDSGVSPLTLTGKAYITPVGLIR
jgi:hypothetical protein